MFTDVYPVVFQQSWKTREAWKLVGKEKPRGFALLYLQTQACGFYFYGPWQKYHDRASRDPIWLTVGLDDL